MESGWHFWVRHFLVVKSQGSVTVGIDNTIISLFIFLFQHYSYIWNGASRTGLYLDIFGPTLGNPGYAYVFAAEHIVELRHL